MTRGLGHPAPSGPILLLDLRPGSGQHGQRGIGRYVRGLGEAVAALPPDIASRVVTLDPAGSRTGVARGADIGRQSAPGWAASDWATAAWTTRRALRRSRATVFHATDPQHPWVGMTVRSLVTVYDLIPLREVGLVDSWRLDHRARYRRYLGQIHTASRIMTISRTTALEIHELLGIESPRIDVVYPLITAERMVDRIVPDEPTFLVVGALDPHKRPELALEAFGRFIGRWGSGRLRFIGPDDPRRRAGLERLAADLGVLSLVTFEGRIADQDLDEAYRTATALVSTSRIEGFGLPPVEALLRGVPVIAVANPAAIETVGGVASIVPADVEAIADAMARPAMAPESAVGPLRERYSLAATAKALAESYRRVFD